ncbi:hypothetical protein, partial [Streptomyces sp. NPDC058953]|uniref:hypothetical protein n=1 Tax=Streptomyces sp. NPDC058953 TaxID=3346676 RepID=UPI003688349A
MDTGAGSLRVRVTPTVSDTVSLLIADLSGAPVASVDSLVIRAADYTDVGGAARGRHDSLYGFARTRVPVGAPDQATRWAVVGTDPVVAATGLRSTGLTVDEYADVTALPASGDRPGAVLLDRTNARSEASGAREDADAATHTATADALADVRDRLGAEHPAAAPQGVLTRGAAALHGEVD